jgi:superfamily II DNA or RNA helicase
VSTLLSDEQEQEAALRIAEMFNATQLRNILKPRLVNALRSYKRHTLGRDTNPTKVEVAAALIIENGTELFRNKEIRDAIAKHLRIKPIDRWHAGHRSSVHFVEQAGFPSVFSGAINGERPKMITFLKEKRKTPALEAFQRNAKNRLLGVAQDQGKRVLLQLPTGSGKTRIAVDTLREFLTGDFRDEERRGYAVIWCAHQDELCDQAAQTIEDTWVNSDESCPLNLIRYYGYTPDDALEKAEEDEQIGTPSILVTTPAKALRLLTMDSTSNEFVASLQTNTRLVVIDEAHRAGAPTYLEILSKLPPITTVIGLTATPYRQTWLGSNGTDELLRLFNDHVIKPESLFEDFSAASDMNAKQFLLQKRILAKPIVSQIRTGKRLSDSSLTHDTGDYEADAMAVDSAIVRDIAADQDRTRAIYRAVLPVFKTEGASIMYFAPTIQDALTMTFLLRVEGIAAECVHAETPDGLRRKYIRQFKDGRLRVLCNVEVLTTGFDAPRVTHVVVARPTVSRVLYEQIVGRGLRGPRFGGTEECQIIDCLDTVPNNRMQFGYQAFREEWGISDVSELRS